MGSPIMGRSSARPKNRKAGLLTKLYLDISYYSIYRNRKGRYMFFKHLRDHCDSHRAEGDRRFARDEFGGGFFGRGRHGFGGHGFGGRHGRRFGRIFEHGDLRYVVLQMIAEKPRYGYEVIKAIEEKLGGAYTPSPGVIYPTLTLLEETGYATVSEAEGNKKLYAITEAGKAFLAENK